MGSVHPSLRSLNAELNRHDPCIKRVNCSIRPRGSIPRTAKSTGPLTPGAGTESVSWLAVEVYGSVITPLVRTYAQVTAGVLEKWPIQAHGAPGGLPPPSFADLAVNNARNLTSGQSNVTECPHRRHTWTVQSYSPGSANVHLFNACFLAQRVHTPNDISIDSAVFARLTIVINRQTDRQTTLLRP